MRAQAVARIALPLAALAGTVALVSGCANSTATGGGSSETIGGPPRETPRERVSASVRYLPVGRVRLDIVSRHRLGVRWGGQTVHWYLGTGRDGRPQPVRIGRTRETRAGVTRMTTTLTVPQAGPFRFAACFSALLQNTLGMASSHGPCGPDHFRGPANSPYVGAGVAPPGYPGAGAPGYPGAGAIAAAASFLKRRSGYTAFAVIDSEGRIKGRHLHRTFVSASVVKAMLLVAYLRKLAAGERRLDATSRSLLEPMIHLSDNDAATAVWERDGDRRLRALARRAGMTDFSLEDEWGTAQISAADQARYFFEMEGLVPARFRHFANHLLSHIAGYESWGIPAEARPRSWTVFFKGGWRGTWRGQLVHQVARLRRPHGRVAIAVMTDGDPSMDYGIDTIQGIAARLLRRHP